MELGELFKQMVGKGALDLHLTVPSVPVCHINGILTAQEDLLPPIPEDIEAVFEQVSLRNHTGIGEAGDYLPKLI
jgi:Tfp pilus assembly pilus retraction ATPase PilT